MNKHKWLNKVTTWPGPLNKRHKGRPKRIWIVEIHKVAGMNWITKAKDRDTWNEIDEAFAR